MAFTSNLLLASALLLFGFPAQAEIYYKYSRQEGGNAAVYRETTDYITTEGHHGRRDKVIAILPEIDWNKDFDKLRSVDLSMLQEKWLRQDRDDFSNEDDECYGYITNGSHIIRAGKIVRNSFDAPIVDVASFRAFGRFAADKDSLYFDGVRTDDNTGEKRVNMAALKAVANNTTMLTDGHSLYVKGRWQGSASRFTALAQKPWRKSGSLDDSVWKWKSKCPQSPQGAFDVIARTDSGLLINGEPIDADPDSFKIVRWMPNALLVYRDKNGIRRYVFGKGKMNETLVEQQPIDCSRAFELRADKVTWQKQRATKRGGDCVVETLSGVDPELFRLVTERVAQYQDRLYVATETKFGEKQLEVITLDKPDLVINKHLNAGNRYGYLVRDFYGLDKRKMVFVFATSGPMVVLTNNSYPNGVFAHDERYVYIFDDYGQLHRHETANPESVWIRGGRLATAEGFYSSSNGAFSPHAKNADDVP
ncbi:hypothetical protein [Leminorella richardii]|nr:hypothetical protein [Leminorella richardii]